MSRVVQDLVSRNPRSVLWRVTLPVHQVLATPAASRTSRIFSIMNASLPPINLAGGGGGRWGQLQLGYWLNPGDVKRWVDLH